MKVKTWTDFKKEVLGDIKKGPCIKVIGDGEMVFYAVIHPEEEMMNRIEGLCSQIDASRGF